MKKNILFVILVTGLIAACQKNETETITDSSVSDADLKRIESLGFNSANVIRFEDGFIVENDLFLSQNDLLNSELNDANTIGANSEHYRTPSLVSVPSGVIRVFVSPSIPPALSVAVDSALLRYNSLGLSISFLKVPSSSAHIHILPVSLGGTKIGVSGFPSGGSPFMPIRLNVPLLSTWIQPTVITSITHLIGHSIGFLHTDILSPAYSCFGSAITDTLIVSGPTPGPVHIPGTPTGPSPASWMLSCIGNGINRPFTPVDIAALNFVY